MNVKNKIEKIEKKLKLLCDREFQKGNIERTLGSLCTLASIEYMHNKDYVDPFIENYISKLSKKEKTGKKHKTVETVLFYDGFGLDGRGLARIYLRGLSKLGYKVLYLTVAKNQSEQPNVLKELNKKAEIYYINTESYTKHLNNLREILDKLDFQAAFFYSSPWDAVGAVAFEDIKGKCNRYLINLTDHAFWVGIGSFDYCIEFRNYGASISHHYRSIDRKKLLLLPFYPIIDETIDFQGLPSQLKNKTFIFSGGSLYKTIDKEKTFYKIIDYVIKKHENVAFIYAGQGYDLPMKELIRKYPSRVFLINERKDFFEILKRARFYLNTYPISGGLMLQYAARANCLPVTLKREWDDDATGILLDDNALNETFTNEKELYDEIDRLLTDDDYIVKKRKLLRKQVITETSFNCLLKKIIEDPKSEFTDDDLPLYDTRRFRQGYEEIATYDKISETIVNKRNRSIYFFFPVELLYKLAKRIERFMRSFFLENEK